MRGNVIIRAVSNGFIVTVEEYNENLSVKAYVFMDLDDACEWVRRFLRNRIDEEEQ